MELLPSPTTRNRAVNIGKLLWPLFPVPKMACGKLPGRAVLCVGGGGVVYPEEPQEYFLVDLTESEDRPDDIEYKV
jgi:hypothetical protein